MTTAARNPFKGKASGGTTPAVDEREVRRALALLADPAHTVELRGLPSGASRVRLGSDLDGLVRAAEFLSSEGSAGVYFTLNPLSLEPHCDRAAKVADVVRRRWLLVDIDRVKDKDDPHKDDSATDEEKAAAVRVADAVRDALTERGWPLPVEVDSGNGRHLLYRIDLPADEDSRVLLRSVLHRLGDEFDTAEAKVDRSVHNASRVSKLPGTWARKGVRTPVRPWRLARIVCVPGDGVEAVPDGLLREAARHPAAQTPSFADAADSGDGSRNGGGPKSPFTVKAAGSPEGGSAYARSALEREIGRLAGTTEYRNNQLNRSAFALGQFVGAGLLGEAEVVSALERTAAQIGLDAREIPATVCSGVEAGKAQPRKVPERNGTHPASPAAPAAPPPGEWEPIVPLFDLPDPEPFPLSVFPEPVRRFADEAAWALSCPVDFVAVPMLAVASGAAGNSRRLAITRTHTQPALLFTCVVGDPGTGKSPALDVAAEPLEEAQKRHLKRYEADRAAYEADPDATPKPPPPLRVLVDDVTQEALVARLSENPRGVCMVRDELAALIQGMDQYRAAGKGNDRQALLKLWSQGTIRNDRKNNPDSAPVTVYRPFVAICGGTQPSVVASLRGGSRKGEQAPDDGLVDRFLFSYPAGGPARGETWREVSPQAHRSWASAVDELLSLPMVRDEDRGPASALVWLTDGGRAEWQRFTEAHAAELNDEDFPDHLKGSWSKLRGYCGRLALVVHLLRGACGEDVSAGVDEESVRRATLLVGYFKAHARRVLFAMDADRTAARARRIVRWIQREGRTTFKRRELFMDVKNQIHFPRAECLDAPLEKLVRHNYLRVAEHSRPGPGRPPAEVYEVHPESIPKIPTIPKNASPGTHEPNFADCGDFGDGFCNGDDEGEV